TAQLPPRPSPSKPGRAVPSFNPTIDRRDDGRYEQKLEAVGQLAAGVGHDLNNILTGVLAGVHLVVQNGQIDDRSRSRLVKVRDECVRAAAVIRELLSFARQQVI